LLTVAGGAGQAFLRLMHTNLGYDPHNTMDVGIPVHIGSHPNWEARVAYFDRLRSRIAELPEVISVANYFDATPPFNGTNQRFEIMGASAERYNDSRVNLVGPEYFSTLHVPLRQGRVWNHTETMRGAHLAAINETMARRYWPNGNAIGHAIRMPELKESPPMRLAAPGSEQWFQIVGIVGDVRNDGLRSPVKPAIYLPYMLAGIVLSAGLNSLLIKWTDTGSRDPLLLLVAALLLVFTSLLAGLFPARRASTIDPISALRFE
jgi:hypothetical protein